MMLAWVLAAGGLIVVAGLALRGLGPVGLGIAAGADFVIRRDGRGRTLIRGNVPASKHAAIREFVDRHLAEAGAFAVAGSWKPGRALTLRWAGGVRPALRQRARNVLVDLLA